MFQRLIEILCSLRRPECRIVLSAPGAGIPRRGSEQAAGYDLSSAEDLTIPAGGRALVHTGLLVAPPAGYHIEVRPRSGLALKHGITVLNTPGTIDADYRGEIMVILFNTGSEDFVIHAGDRIAQAVVMKHADARWTVVDSLEKTSRGNRGFGSSGV